MCKKTIIALIGIAIFTLSCGREQVTMTVQPNAPVVSPKINHNASDQALVNQNLKNLELAMIDVMDNSELNERLRTLIGGLSTENDEAITFTHYGLNHICSNGVKTIDRMVNSCSAHGGSNLTVAEMMDLANGFTVGGVEYLPRIYIPMYSEYLDHTDPYITSGGFEPSNEKSFKGWAKNNGGNWNRAKIDEVVASSKQVIMVTLGVEENDAEGVTKIFGWMPWRRCFCSRSERTIVDGHVVFGNGKCDKIITGEHCSACGGRTGFTGQASDCGGGQCPGC